MSEHNRKWRFINSRCPECGKQMIENDRYIECGELCCNYIETRKSQQRIGDDRDECKR